MHIDRRRNRFAPGTAAFLCTGLRSVPDAPGALENFYGTAYIAGMRYDLPGYIEAIRAVTAADVARCAAGVKLHTVFFLKGEAK